VNIGGVDLESLELDNSDFIIPDVVPGRILNEDADIIAYNCAGNDETSRETVVFNIKAELQNRMQQVGADHYILHLTGTGSDKGKRHDVACLKQYQAGRVGKPRPKHLEFARTYMATNLKAVVHMDQEADDGLAQTQQQYLDRGERNLCVLDSADKDLRMVQGLHRCPDTGKIIDVDGYGACWYDADKAKTTGWGTSFFWHQLLMGDTADDIPGLPAFSRRISLQYWPTAPLLEQERRIEVGTMPSGKRCTMKQLETASEKLYQLRAEFKLKPCGAGSVASYLSKCTTDTEAYYAVLSAYTAYWPEGFFEFTDWRGKTYTRRAEQMLLEQAFLLWMRRVNDGRDVFNFLESCK
jgi:hypothetical protein